MALVIFGAAVIEIANAAPRGISCPATIGDASRPLTLAGARLFDGPPAEQADLVPIDITLPSGIFTITRTTREIWCCSAITREEKPER